MLGFRWRWEWGADPSAGLDFPGEAEPFVYCCSLAIFIESFSSEKGGILLISFRPYLLYFCFLFDQQALFVYWFTEANQWDEAQAAEDGKVVGIFDPRRY